MTVFTIQSFDKKQWKMSIKGATIQDLSPVDSCIMRGQYLKNRLLETWNGVMKNIGCLLSCLGTVLRVFDAPEEVQFFVALMEICFKFGNEIMRVREWVKRRRNCRAATSEFQI